MAEYLLSLLETAVSSIHSIRYSELASSTVIVFDHLITLDREIELIWNAPWSPGKCLFIVNRYYSLIVVIFNNYALFTPHLSNSFCLHWFRWQGWSGLFLCMTAEIILQLRLFALYYLNTKILVLIVVTFLAASATSAALMGTVLSDITAHSHDIPGTPFCVAYNISNHFYAFWIPILFFETFLCCLAVFRGLHSFTSQSTIYLSGKRIFEILLRDSILYFLVMFATYFVNLIMFVVEPDSLIEIPIGWSVAMSCVMGNRLLLNIRDAVREADLEEQPSFIDPEGGVPLRGLHEDGPRVSLSDNEMDRLRRMRAKGAVV